MFFIRRQLIIYKIGNLKQVGWNYQYIEVFQIKFQGRWLESISFIVGKKIELTKNQSENPWSLDRGMNDVMS